jgi:hypothetical protein
MIITSKQTLPSDWIHHSQAGCSFWVHKSSGEVQTTPPHPLSAVLVEECKIRSPQQEQQTSSSSSQSSCGVTDVGDNDDSGTDATGSLVYDSKEFQDLMHVLGDL